MKTILIVIISFSLDGGVGVTQTEFKTRAACEVARAAVLQQAVDANKQYWGRRNMVIVCVDA